MLQLTGASHTAKGTFILLKNKLTKRKPRARPVPGPLSAEDRYLGGIPAVELSQFQLFPGLSQAPGIKKLLKRSCVSISPGAAVPGAGTGGW